MGDYFLLLDTGLKGWNQITINFLFDIGGRVSTGCWIILARLVKVWHLLWVFFGSAYTESSELARAVYFFFQKW